MYSEYYPLCNKGVFIYISPLFAKKNKLKTSASDYSLEKNKVKAQ